MLSLIGKDSNDQEVSRYTHYTLYTPCSTSTFCVKIPIQTVKVYDQDTGSSFYVAVKAFNIANLPVVGKSSLFTVPSANPPAIGMVYDVAPKTSFQLTGKYDTLLYEADFQFDATKICARWKNFDHYKDTVTYTVGAGTTAGSDNVASFTNVAAATSHCFTGLSLTHLNKYYTTLKATSAAGTTIGSSDGITYMDETTALSNAKVFDGLGCKGSHFHDEFDGSTLTQNSVLTGVGQFKYLFGQYFSIEIETEKIASSLEVKVNDKVVGTVDVNSQLATRDFHYIDFVVLKSNLTIDITNTGSSTVVIHGYKIRKCENDLSYQFSRSTVYARWNMKFEAAIISHITHYETAVMEELCTDVNRTNCNDVGLITDYMSAGLKEKFSFTNVQLKSGYGYKTAVRACFQHMCLSPRFSNGFLVLDKKPEIGSLTPSCIYTKVNETLPQMNFTVKWQPFSLQCGPLTEQISLYEWTVSTSKNSPAPLIPWHTVTGLPAGEVYEVGEHDILV